LPVSLNLDLKMAAGKNVRVRGAGFGAGLDIGATGAAMLRGSLASPQLDGAFTSTGGTLTYFDRAFRVQSGRVSFAPQNGVTPTLKAVGVTHVLNPDPDIARNPYGSADITISVSGPIQNLSIAFDSQPPGYTREQIIAMLAPFGGFVSGIAFGTPTTQVPLPNAVTPLGALQPIPTVGANRQTTLTVGQEAFSILNAQFTAGLLSPFETAVSQGLGLSNLNVTVDYYGNVGFSASRVLGRLVSVVYGTTFGFNTRQSFGVQFAPNETTTTQLSYFVESGPTKLFTTPSATLSTNPQLTFGQPLVGQSGFSFTFQRRYW